MSEYADLLLTNGRIFTLWPDRPWVSEIAVKNGRILDAGDSLGCRGPHTEVLDLKGRTAVPGFTDSHAHLIYYGKNALMWADLGGARSLAEIRNRLLAHAGSPPSEWIRGYGFDDAILEDGRYPTREDLDAVSRDRPVLVYRLCGHACIVNSKAMELAGAEKFPQACRETGLLTEDDMDPIWSAMPELSLKEIEDAAMFAMRKARSTGIIAAQCLINSMDEFQVLQSLHSAGRLPIRLYVSPGYGLFGQLAERGLKTGVGDDMLTIGSAKMFADGSMGAKTAALCDEYTDDPGNTGILLHSDEKLGEMVMTAHLAGWQAAVHAIGDKAVEQAVDAIEAALNKTGEDNLVRRHRIEHASILSEDLVDKMARLKIFAAVQPQFVITDFWTFDRVGPERYRWSYPFRTLIEKGVPTSFGSDCPVERLDAFELIYRAVTRDEYSPGERLSPEETVRVYALGGAEAAFQEDVRGSLKPGKLADIVVLDRDIFSIPAEEIPETSVSLVVLGGKYSEDR